MSNVYDGVSLQKMLATEGCRLIWQNVSIMHVRERPNFASGATLHSERRF